MPTTVRESSTPNKGEDIDRLIHIGKHLGSRNLAARGARQKKKERIKKRGRPEGGKGNRCLVRGLTAEIFQGTSGGER